MSVLVDTNIFVDYSRQRSSAIEYLGRIDGVPSTSIVCVAELIAGAASQREERRIQAFLSTVRVLAASYEIALRAGAFVRHYRASHGVGLGDALIAATAEHHGLELATLNVKHFPMFPRLKPPY